MSNEKGYLEEVEKLYTPLLAIEEASRCLLCYDAPCSNACPANTKPARFIRALRFRNLKGGVEVIRENNILGGICARVCPYDKYCEDACSRSGIDRPINIGALQRYLTDYESKIGMKVLKKVPLNKEKVAIIGSGPSGLSAGTTLARKGYKVTIIEEKERLGGWLTYGIPSYRLPSKVIREEINYIKELGVEFRTSYKIDKDKNFQKLKDEGFKCILIACGLQKNKDIDIRGKNLKGVIKGTDFLAEAKLKNGKIKIGNKVIVIGGGDVAMDSAATAKLLGAEDVKIVYRRSIEKMPASLKEKEIIHSLNIPIFTGLKPLEILGENDVVTGFKAIGMFDNSKLELQADTIILAIGQEISDLDELSYIDKNENGIIIDENYETNLKGVFACGDIVEGDKTVVYAVASGKQAGYKIDEYLTALRQSKEAVEEIATIKEGEN